MVMMIMVMILMAAVSWVHTYWAHMLKRLSIFFALTIKLGLNTTYIKDAIFTYPTKLSDIGYML